MEAQVVKALTKLRKLTSRSQRELRDVLDAALTAAQQATASTPSTRTEGGASSLAEVPFEPFLLAVLTRQPKLVATALDCIEKFLAFGYLRGNGSIPDSIRKRLALKNGAKKSASNTGASTPSSSSSSSSSAFAAFVGYGSSSQASTKDDGATRDSGMAGNNGHAASASPSVAEANAALEGSNHSNAGVLHEANWKLIDCIIEVICDCNDHPDEAVQLQVLRVLLTAVTTTTCEVHEHSLLKAVRACYHIHLVSKSTTNQTVAKATLQQIIAIVFQRMETFDQRVEEETQAHLKQAMQQRESEEHMPGASVHENGEQEADAKEKELKAKQIEQERMDDEARRPRLASASAAWYPDVARVLQLTTATAAAPASVSAPRQAVQSSDGSTMGQRKADRPPSSASSMFAPSFPSVLHKDAFLLFRSLCRISMRSVADDSASGSSSSSGYGGASSSGNPNEDPFAFQSKILSLELVLSIINSAGPSFRRGERFVHAIRQYLCQSLLQNCTSNYTRIVELSLQVFLVLINNFKRHLKAEIEIFVTSIFLRILQSENSSFEHKMLVLEVLNNICDDASILGEIFLNYDCDWVSNDLFKQIVDALAKIAKGKKDTATQYANLSSSVRIKLQQNDAALVLKGLECLTATVASLKKAANFVENEKKNEVLDRTSSSQSTAGTDMEDDGPLAPPTASAPPPPPPMSTTMSAVEAFDRKKRRQEELANGILKFNVKPTGGIQYLVERGHLDQGTPRDVARFLHEHNDKLDKTMVGEYLGKEVSYQDGFCIKVLHEYVDMMDFTGMEIDLAIRIFLSGFRLPGEAQKIDRMMEKFAERYYASCQSDLFPSADTAFILSFSIIMLQTDLHNPSIPDEKKMDKGGFLRNNRGINNGEDLPEEYLGAIYDRIKQSPISLKEDEDYRARAGGRRGASSKSSGASSIFGSAGVSDRQRRDAYIKERESMVRQSEALFKRRNPATSMRNLGMSPRSSGVGGAHLSPHSFQFHLVTEFTEMSHVRPMFETVWAPLLACCSVIFESSDSPVAIQLCLNSFKHAIHLAARLDMPSERDAFVTVLAKFTALHSTATRVMKSKNIEAIKALISISVKEGNYLGDAWRDVLQCISHLARIQMHAQGLDSDAQFFRAQPSPSSSSNLQTASFSTPTNGSSNMRRTYSSSSASFSASPSHRESSSSSGGSVVEDTLSSAIEAENAARVMTEVDVLASDRVFSSSVTLSDSAVQEFVLQLCVVSLTECSGITNGRVMSSTRHEQAFSPPRVFSLQKLVEVADMNMHTRSRVVWASMWKVLSRHFTTIGCHDNLSIAMYAIDSLRQLSMKFLEKEELKDFNFQRLFLTPFEVIMANAISMEIRELVLRCVENMILARCTNIKSGWKTIWGVLRVAAETYDAGNEDKDDRIVQMGFQIAQRIFHQHFDRIVEVFVDAVECLVAFAVCGSEEVEKNMEEHLGLTQLSVYSIDILEQVCMEKLATGQVIEKMFTESSGGKRVGFKRKNLAGEGKRSRAGSMMDVEKEDWHQTTPRPLRYERQESTRALEEEIAALSPPGTPRRHSIAVPSPLNEESSQTGIYTDSSLHTRLWWPVLTALSTLAADRRIDVRLSALQALFDSLETHGMKFSTGLWSLIFKGVLIPLLDELRHLEVFIERGVRHQPKLVSTRPAALGKKSTSTICLERLLEAYGLYYDVVGFLPEVLFLLGKCMDTTEQEEDLAAASAASLEKMLVVHGHKFPEDVWGLIADELRSVMQRAQPTWVFHIQLNLANPMSPSSGSTNPLSPRVPGVISMYPSVVSTLKFTFSGFPMQLYDSSPSEGRSFPSRTHLVVMLALQRVLGNVLSSRYSRHLALSDGHFVNLLSCLKESYAFARRLNDSMSLRRHFHQVGWIYGTLSDGTEGDLPNLLDQEVAGKEEYVKVLFSQIHETREEDSKRAEARRLMTTLVKQTCEEYIAWSFKSPSARVRVVEDAQRRVVAYKALMLSILHHFTKLDASEMEKHLGWAYPLFNELVKTPDQQVREALALVYARSIAQLLPIHRAAV